MGPARLFAASDAVAATMGMESVGVSLCAQPMYASDRLAARVEDRQFVLGQGPLLGAYLGECAIEAPDTSDHGCCDWLSLDLAADGIGAVFAFPMIVDDACLGALTLYRQATGPLSDGQRALGALAADAAALETATHLLLARQARTAVPALHRVHALQQAIGIVMDQLSVDADEATTRIRAYAYRTERSAADVVDDLRHHRLELADDRIRHGE